MAKAPTGHSIAADYCRKFPNTPSKTLGRKMYAEHVERFASLDVAYQSIRRVRGAHGKLDHNRVAERNKVPRPLGKSGWKPQCPPSAAEEWKPLQIDGPCRVLSLSDVHIPFHSKEAVEAAVAYGKKLKPDVVILLGDIADFYNISRWERDPKQRDFKYELDAVKEFLSWIRATFRQARMIFKLGNHEVRFDRYIFNKAPELWNVENVQLQNVLDFERFGIERVDDQPILAGKLVMLHGHETGKTLSTPVNPARGLFLRTKHTALIGHLHQTSEHAESNLWHDEVVCWSQGCLSDLSPTWLRINRWNHGASHVDVAGDGQFSITNFRISRDFKVRA